MIQMPVIFVGHGSPMNAIEENQFSKKWNVLGQQLPRPKAILAISAHWYTNDQRVMSQKNPKIVYDMYGFPKELYKVEYPVQGDQNLAEHIRQILGDECLPDESWGIDHGTWSVLRWMYPKADIPVVQLSVDRNASLSDYVETGKKLQILRQEGVLIFGSGNVVHNLGMVDWNQKGGFSWADEFDAYVKNAVTQQNTDDAVEYKKAGSCAVHAFLTAEHYAPLLYCLGAAAKEDSIEVFNEERIMGSLSMTGYLFQGK